MQVVKANYTHLHRQHENKIQVCKSIDKKFKIFQFIMKLRHFNQQQNKLKKFLVQKVVPRFAKGN